MGKYGIYTNATDFYNNLIIDNEIKYIKDSNNTLIGKVVKLTALGVKAVTIETDDKKKYIIFPKEANKCELKDN
jgi:hypothetical protein